jgi:hypothetical protein
MIKHFLIRLLIVILIIILVPLFSIIFVYSALSDDELRIMLCMVSFFIFFTIIGVVLALIRDSKTQYRKQQEDKANASLLVLFIFLFILFVVAVISFH